MKGLHHHSMASHRNS